MVHNVPNNARKQQEKRLSRSSTLKPNPLGTILRSGTCLHDSHSPARTCSFFHLYICIEWWLRMPRNSGRLSGQNHPQTSVFPTTRTKLFQTLTALWCLTLPFRLFLPRNITRRFLHCMLLPWLRSMSEIVFFSANGISCIIWKYKIVIVNRCRWHHF